jgi:hypothetical protein
MLSLVGLIPQGAEAVDFLALAATTTDSRSVTLQYEVTGEVTGMVAVPIQIWRSADATVDSETDLLIGSGTIESFTTGPHEQEIDLPDGGELALSADRPYVLVLIDPITSGAPTGAVTEDNESNNLAVFRKYTVAVIVHGLTFLDAPPRVGESDG